jgi:hypothetical protein
VTSDRESPLVRLPSRAAREDFIDGVLDAVMFDTGHRSPLTGHALSNIGDRNGFIPSVI